MSILASVIGAGVAGASNLVSDLLNNRASRRAATQAYERNLSNWMMETDYNSPKNQMQRLKDAKLNPNLIYGSVNNSAGAVSSAPVANSGFSDFNPVTAYQNFVQKDAMTQQIDAQTDLIKAQTKALRLENKENEDNGTSRATPYPVKLGKSVVEVGRKSVDTLATPVSSAISSAYYRYLPSWANRAYDGIVNKLMGKSFDYGKPGNYQRMMRR